MGEISKVGGAFTAPINYTLLTTSNAVAPKVVPDAIPMPEGMPIRNRISNEFNIEVLDSDVKFNSVELIIIEDVLKKFKERKRKHHLLGVLQIIKNKEARIRLLKKLLHAGGAYDSDYKRVYLFDNLKPEEIPEVLTHEIGHAVHHNNVEFHKFMHFMAGSGYNLIEFRKYFNQSNALYQVATRRVKVPVDKWHTLIDRFSMKSLMMNNDVFGEIMVDSGRIKSGPWDENALEKFAWVYQWFSDKKDEFEAMAIECAERGDYSWLNAMEFMKKEVFRHDIPA